MRSSLPKHVGIRHRASSFSASPVVGVATRNPCPAVITRLSSGSACAVSSVPLIHCRGNTRTAAGASGWTAQSAEEAGTVDYAAQFRLAMKQQHREIHTSSTRLAQALPAPDYEWADTEEYNSDLANEPYPYELFDSPGPSSLPQLAPGEWEPQEIETYPEDYHDYIESDASEETPMHDGELEDFPEGANKPRRARRKRRPAIEQSPPPLPAGEAPGEDETRYDWRLRSPSRIRRRNVNSKKWFPGLHVNRVGPPQRMLEDGDAFYAEVGRYEDHFKPLLQAEHDEERRLHSQRQAEWTEERLTKEGYMLQDMLGVVYNVKKKDAGFIYGFTKSGGDATRGLPFHRFQVGAFVELSRTHPHTNHICSNGLLQNQGGDTPMLGTVYSVGKGFIRVAFENEVQEVEKGAWSDFALKRQLRAIQSLNLDPYTQDRGDFLVTPPPTLRHVESDEDMVLAESPYPKRREQTKLEGTALRDLLLRRFQEDYTPTSHPPSASPPSDAALAAKAPDVHDVHGLVADPSELTPDTVDATPAPTLHLPGSSGILSRNQLIQSWTRRYSTPPDVTPLEMEGDPDVPLNPTQLRAVAMILRERLSLVQGPPGTGKTRVIIETVKLLKHVWEIPHPVLLTAHTNAAVDNMVAGLVRHGVKAVRFGPTERVRADLQDWTFESQFDKHPSAATYEMVKERVERGFKLIKETSGQEKLDLVASLAKDRYKASKLREEITREVLLDADVICTTLLSSVAYPLSQIDFPMVFLDEASMATEPLSLIALTKGSSHVAIIGDHKQLPPIIISPAAHAGGLATSMFERLIHEHHIPSIMLDTQYRMHPSIASFPSQAFYSDLLRNGTVDTDGSAFPRFDPPETAFLLPDDKGRRMNMTFVHHSHPESPEHRSVANYGDAEKVCDVVADLLNNNPSLQGADIGIITPYSANIRLLDHYLHTEPRRAAAFLDLLGPDRVRQLDEIEIKTVDGFEGREKDIIIFSAVRSNDAGHIGFLGDWRRLNVALTRAKRGLIMIGNADTLGKARTGKYAMESLPSGGAKVWREFIGHLREGNMILET